MTEQNTPPTEQARTGQAVPGQVPAEQAPEWGGPAPERAPQARWSGRKTAAAVAVAVGVAAAGGFAVYAASGSTAAAQGGPGGMGGPGGAMGGPGGGAGGIAGALHGEFVVSDGNGGYTTEILQTGEVTAVSATSLTARSADGYTKTYTLDADTVFGRGGTAADLATGDTVTVVGTPSGDSATADSVSERGQGMQGGPMPGGGGQQQGVPPRRDGSTGSDASPGNQPPTG